MRHTLQLFLLAGFFAATSLAHAYHGHNHGISVSTDDRDVTSCDQLQFRSGNREIARSEDRLTLPQTSSPVRINAADNGGMYVYGWDRQDFGVLNCKAALSDERTTAERKLQQIKMSFDDGRLTVSGPDESDWTSYLIIHAPRSSSLSLAGMNGPISISDLAGKVDVHCTNGPFAIKNSAGEVNAEIVNGPIDYAGNSGDIHLHAQNGPIAIKLIGTSWSGKGLDAESMNGPMALKLPNNYRSGVLVQARGYSPFSCSGCEGAHKDFDDHNKSVQFGSGTPVVRLSTVNGPVSINERDFD
ncbi:MAG TPA: hypothetical protein VNX88_03110 [Terriglobales bacterium]|jgi:DUF4097 and DUF4098 domain-containing protein YvlB|nr:hypothetical protein [Terriglobales bacterium]